MVETEDGRLHHGTVFFDHSDGTFTVSLTDTGRQYRTEAEFIRVLGGGPEEAAGSVDPRVAAAGSAEGKENAKPSWSPWSYLKGGAGGAG